MHGSVQLLKLDVISVFVGITEHFWHLLDNTGIAVVQGSAFGLEGFFRISYATSMENLKKALEKISNFCRSLN